MARGNERGRLGGLQSHYFFEDRYGRPGKGNGQRQCGGGGRLCPRRNFMIAASPVRELGRLSMATCEEQCTQPARSTSCAATASSIGERFVRDREALKRPLPAPFDACDKQGTRVSSLSLVRYRTNDYSVPVAYGHQEVCRIQWLCPRGGYRLRRRGSLPDTNRSYDREAYGLRSDPLPAFAGAQDRCPGSGRGLC